MISALTQLALPALLALDPETAHEATLKALELGLYPADRATGYEVGDLRGVIRISVPPDRVNPR